MTRLLLLMAVVCAGCDREPPEPQRFGAYGMVMGPALCSRGDILTSCDADEVVELRITDSDSGKWVSFTIDPPVLLHKGDVLTIEPETAASCTNDDCTLVIYDERGHVRTRAKK